MRKSSQGKRRVSQPLRMDFEDQRASSSRRPLDVRRASGIPQPGKNRRSSSENRDGRMSALPPMKRFNSQQSLLATPAASTPQSQMFLSPFSDGGRSSRKSAYSGVGGGKQNRVIKDSRPFTDKTFLQQEIQKITNFLHAHPEAMSLAAKGINLRQLTMKLFVDLVNFLMGFLDDDISVNMANYVNEIPLIMKKWGYVGNLNTSWLKTVNTPHALPHVVGLLSWLVSLASCGLKTEYEAATEHALSDDPDSESDFVYGNLQVFMQHLMKQYGFWNSREEAAEENEERRFIEELFRRNGVSYEEERECAAVVEKYEMQLQDPKEQAEIAAIMEEEKKRDDVLNDYNKVLSYKNQMEEFLNICETRLEEEKRKLLKEEEAVRDLQSKISELQTVVSNQVMTVEERDELLKLCSELSSSIRENEEYVALVSNQSFADDLEMAKRVASLKKKNQAYNKLILMESSWLPELKTLMDETNFHHQEAAEKVAEIESQAHKLKEDIQLKYDKIDADLKELQSKVLQVEERKLLVLQDEEQILETVKQYETSIESFKVQSQEENAQLKKKMNSLKASNEVYIASDALQKARDNLQRLIEKRDKGKSHIEKSKQKAEVFFKKSVAITQGFIDTVSKTKAEYERKTQNLARSTRDKLEKIRKETEVF